MSDLPETAGRVNELWVGQKVRSGFHRITRKNPNELFGQLNIRVLCRDAPNLGELAVSFEAVEPE